MKTPKAVLRARIAVMTIAEIKAATDAFDRGESNVFDAMDAIIAAVEAYQESPDARREAA